jgi:hypothetical protein
LGAIANSGPTKHGTEIGHNLSDCDLIRGEVVLIAEHRRVEILQILIPWIVLIVKSETYLRAMRHKVETSHKQNHVCQKNPVPLQSNFPFCNEGRADIAPCLPDGHSLVKGVGLGQHESEDNDKHRRAGTEPEQRAPPMGRSIDKSTGEDCGKEIAKCISLLQHTGDDTPSGWGTIFKCGGCCVAVKATHGNSKERSAPEELIIGLGETSALSKLAQETMIIICSKPTNSRTINRTLLATKGHFLPYLSAARPKIMAPTDLNINTRVIPQVISVFETLN